jgi:hypothetical protein
VALLDELAGRDEAKAVSRASDEDAGHAGWQLSRGLRLGGMVLRRGHFYHCFRSLRGDEGLGGKLRRAFL